MKILPITLIVALLNGLFLLLSKVWADRKLDEMRTRHNEDLEQLKTSLNTLREFALKHLDDRRSLYWDALDPFIKLFVITSTRAPTKEETAAFREHALIAAARVRLLAPDAVRGLLNRY